MQDKTLIESIRTGDSSAWQALLEAHQEPIFRLAYLLLGDPADADDVTQETFLRAYRSLGQFDVSRPLRPWLFSIATNLARNRRRSLGRYAAAVQRWFGQRDPAPPGGVEARTAAQQEARELWQAVCRLRHDDQTVIYLRFFLELPVDETAAALGVASGTVKSRLSRALGRLREVIESDFPDLRSDSLA